VLRAAGGVYYDVNAFNSTLYFRQPFVPYGIGWEARFVPASPSCADPGFPMALPPRAPGLIDDVLGQWDAYQAEAAEAEANHPDTPTIFELTRGVANGADPAYRTPRSLLSNVGFQRQLRPGLVLSVDYVRSRGSHYPVYQDRNRVGAADTLSEANARGAMDALQSSLGCPAGLRASRARSARVRRSKTTRPTAWARARGPRRRRPASSRSRAATRASTGWSSRGGTAIVLRRPPGGASRTAARHRQRGAGLDGDGSYTLSRYEAETDDRVFGNVGGDTTSNDDPVRFAGRRVPTGSTTSTWR